MRENVPSKSGAWHLTNTEGQVVGGTGLEGSSWHGEKRIYGAGQPG